MHIVVEGRDVAQRQWRSVAVRAERRFRAISLIDLGRGQPRTEPAGRRGACASGMVARIALECCRMVVELACQVARHSAWDSMRLVGLESGARRMKSLRVGRRVVERHFDEVRPAVENHPALAAAHLACLQLECPVLRPEHGPAGRATNVERVVVHRLRRRP